jgi:acetyl-CoA acetyltransferase
MQVSTSRSHTPGAAIVGIGATEFSKASGRSEQRLAVEAIQAALTDAGVSHEEIDGIVTLAVEANYEQALQRYLGIPGLTFFARAMGGGGGGAATVALAALAIQTGSANVVVCYRAMNERSQLRFGIPPTSINSGVPTTQTLDMAWTAPFGVVTPAASMALNARRYLHIYNRTTDDFARLAVAQRGYAATNEKAFFYGKPLTIDDYYQSRMIADPLRLLDCCQESDGAVAIVLTSAERATHSRHRPVYVKAGAMGLVEGHLGMAHMFRDPGALPLETATVGEQLWKKSGLTPADIDVAILYDHFGPAVLMQLEALGFCRPGEAGDLIADGGIALDGQIPLNTHGGQMGEAYIHGFNGIAEAIRQLRGDATNQVPGAAHVLVTAASHVPTSGIILGLER